MSDTSKIHRINYDFNPFGLTPGQCTSHAADAQAKLAARFDIDLKLVRVRVDPKADPNDVRVMRGAGSTSDHDRNVVAWRVITPLWRALHYCPKLLLNLAPPAGPNVIVVRVAKPLQIAMV
jgi:hypothetical protein